MVETVVVYRITGKSFCCSVKFRDGKMTAKEAAPYLRRLSAMTLGAFMQYAEQHGWKLEVCRDRK